MPSTTSAEPTSDVHPARLGHSLPLACAGAILLLIAAAGWGLIRLGDVRMPERETRRLVARDDGSIHVIETPRKPGSLIDPTTTTVVCSRHPVAINTRRSLVRFEDGVSRVLPPGAPLVLIRADRRVVPLDRHFPLLVARRLLRQPPVAGERLEAWFERPEVAGDLREFTDLLREFWR